MKALMLAVIATLAGALVTNAYAGDVSPTAPKTVSLRAQLESNRSSATFLFQRSPGKDGPRRVLKVSLSGMPEPRVEVLVGERSLSVPVAGDGTASLKLDSDAGDRVPSVSEGQRAAVELGGRVLMSGKFRRAR